MKVEVGRVVVNGVQVPGEGVPLIKGVVYDMLRDGVNCFGRRTMLHLELVPSKMENHDEESQFHAVHQLSDGRHRNDEEGEELVAII